MIRLDKWLCCLLLMAGACASALESSNSKFLVSAWRNEEGLPHTTINSILQSRDGYLWIGTYVGLVRFDGLRFVQYSASEMPDLGNGRISHLFEDRDGALWIALENGRLLEWKDNAVRVRLTSGSTNQPVVSMVQQTNGTLWVKMADGALGQVAPEGVKIVSPSHHGAERRSLELVIDGNDQIWGVTSKGLQLWKNGGWRSPGIKAIEGQQVEALERARDGAVWVFCKSQLWKVRSGEILAQIAPPAGISSVLGMLEASDGCFWLGSGNGALFYLEPGTTWKEIPKTGFQGQNRLLYEDREGNLWRGGFGTGLTRIRTRLFSTHELPELSLERYARAICPDTNGNLWAILNSQVLSRIPAGSQTPEAVVGVALPYPIKTVFVDRSNDLWLGASGSHLYRFRNGKQVTEIDLGQSVEMISALYEDAEENLWVGFRGGAGVGFLSKKDRTHWQPLEGMPYPDVRTIAQASDGSMWFGTHYGGAFRWHDKQWTRFTMQEGLPSDYVRCLLADPDGTVWLGTMHGLGRWRDGKLASIRTPQGLWNDSLSHLSDDGQGSFWISSFGGVFQVKKESLNNLADGKTNLIQCIGYNRQDGLISVECSGGFQPAGAKTPDGRLWIPTAGGLVSVQTQNLHPNPLPPPVWIEEATIDDKPHTIEHSPSVLTVAPGERRLDIRFTALSLSASEKVLFRHKLEGLDTEWSRPSAQRSVSYSYIPPGQYNFQVKACNNDGLWNDEGKVLSIIIQPFVWQTWWFKTGLGLIFTITLALSVRRIERWKARIQLERLERQNAVERERSRIAKDIHDDLGANLTQIVFLSQRAGANSHDPREVEQWIGKIPTIASRTIRSLDEIVWAINPKHDSLESLANYLSRYAQEFLSLAGLRCQLDVSTVLPAVSLSAEVRHNLVLTAREALQNVVSHSGATEARVKLQLEETNLTIVIADNGRGFDLNGLSGDGNGLPNMSKRLGDLGGSLEFSSQPGSGTTVTFTLPRRYLQGRKISTPP